MMPWEIVKEEEGPFEYKATFMKQEDKTESLILKKMGSKCRNDHFEGAWTRIEQIAYFRFIIENSQVMGNAKLRKRYRVFKKMGESIGTRGTIQCKSHHQKMMIAHQNNFDKLIAYGHSAYLSESALNLLGNIRRVDGQYATQNFYYRIYTRGSNFKIIINDKFIRNYQ